MNRNKVLLRADGSSEIGLGHLYRLYAIYEMISPQYSCTFLVSENSSFPFLVNDKLVRIPNDIDVINEPEWIFSEYSCNEYILILDGYQFISDYQKKVRNLGFKQIYIDDLQEEYMYADVIVNHSLELNEAKFKSIGGVKYALGTDYAMLRSSFLYETKFLRKVGKQNGLFICFGGSDPKDFTNKFVQMSLQVFDFEKIHVVIGSEYKHTEINRIALVDERIKIYQNLNELQLLNVIKKCQLAIAPGSTILYELCAVNIGILSGVYVNNQHSIYNGLVSNGCVLPLGQLEKVGMELLKSKFEQLNLNGQIKNQFRVFENSDSDNFLGLLRQLN